ncbi:MAG TPA: amino acid adenylation domain-containing protein, partial [Thermoanaerobaculia bacterium]|nr:amino acid adenylation domain-containing protein [Thermoanaerobaculia bacterium]
RPEIEPVLGCFLTQVPFALDLSGDPSCRELLSRVRQAALGAYAHQDLPFGKLVEAIHPQRDAGRQPLVQALVQVLDSQPGKVRLSGATFEAVDAYDGRSRYDLMLSLFDLPAGLSGSLEFDSDLFDATTVERLVELFFLQAEVAANDPERRLSSLPVLTAAARQQALVEWNDTSRPAGTRIGWTVPGRFSAQAARAPEALAVAAGGAELSYAELDRLSTLLARQLRAVGVVPEALVALLLDRTVDIPVAILGVWKAGGAYIPLDLSAPAARLATLLADAAPVVVVHRGALPPGIVLPDGTRSFDLATPREPTPEPLSALAEPRPEQAAYLIYTSGTTGRPKAVVVEHGGVAAMLGAVLERLPAGPNERVPHLARYSFDISLLELFLPLLIGGATEIVAESDVLEPERLLDVLERCTRVFCVPTLLRPALPRVRERAAERFAGLRMFGIGGEVVPADLQAEVFAAFPAVRLEIIYGPTETSVVCALRLVSRTEPLRRVLLGFPLAGVEVRVMTQGRLAPLGVPGELWIGGSGVGREYFRRPELTAEAFVTLDGRRFYRSGDLVRQVPALGGTLEFLGRLDFQVKVRGFRVELGEIEAALATHAAVRQAVVVAKPDGRGGQRLAAYWVRATEGAGFAGEVELHGHLARLLPSYMIPAQFLELPELPLTASGKADRSRLPEPAAERAAPQAEEAAGAEARWSPAEEMVAGIWSEVLELPRAFRQDNFFELGGHSLLATQVVSRLRAATGVELPIRTLFQAPTVAALAAALTSLIAQGGSAAAAPPIERRAVAEDPPLSFAQERLWFMDRLAPGNAAYNIPLALAARGDLSIPAMEAALGEMVRRHEALRTTYPALAAGGNRAVQRIAPPGPWRLPLVDLEALPAAARLAEANRIASFLIALPFDLSCEAVLRNAVVRLAAAAEHALILVIHHIAADGWSVGVIVEEITALYAAARRGAPSPLPELPVQYGDFALWQRSVLAGEILERQLAYWRERLAGAAGLDLPTDHPRPPVQSFRGATRMHTVGPQVTQRLKSLARAEDSTLFMVLLAAVQTLLGRYSGQDDVVLGSPIANRTRSEIEPLIGFFVNSLVLRGDLRGDPTFLDLLARSRRLALEAYSHQDLPFERLVEELRPERKLAHNPLFQVMFAVQNAPMRPIALPGLHFAPVDFQFPATRFDLEIFFTENAGALSTQLTWSLDLFDAPTALRLLGHLDELLAGVLENPAQRLSELALLAAPERQQILAEWNDTAAELPSGSLAALFLAQVERRADAVALSSIEGELTYRELARQAGRLAAELVAAGVGPEVRVALLAQRSPAMVVGILGILMAGGAYVPLDPSYPAERLGFLLADARAQVLFGQRELLDELPEEVAADLTTLELAVGPGKGEPTEFSELWEFLEPAEAPARPRETEAESLAYVMYTSGSTGRPKGVGVTQGNIVRLVRRSGFADLGPEQVFLQLAPISFDASTLELWAPLLNGGRLALFPPRRPSFEEIGEAVARWGVTSLWLTAGLFHLLVDENLAALAPLSQLLAGGDVLSPVHVRRALAKLPGLTLINGYGPTEGTTFSCCRPMTDPGLVGAPGASVPLGRPIGNTRIAILGPRLESLPTGIWGELWVGGQGLSRGYLDRPEATAEAFRP